MATVINGTDNTAATPALTGTDTDTGVFFPAANTMAFSTGGTEKVRVDSSGNVGIGTTTVYAGAKAQVNGQMIIGSGVTTSNIFSATLYARNGTDRVFAVQQGTADSTGIKLNTFNDAGSANIPLEVNGSIFIAKTGETERMRINSSGSLLVGVTSFTSGGGGVELKNGGTNRFSVTGTGAIQQIGFHNPNGEVGSIFTSGSSTTFATSSDYRLKENIAPMTGALDKVSALKPVTYNWKVDGSDGQGFIAHELQEVVPECVIGEKDAVETVDEFDADGKKIGTKEVPRYQGIDTSFLVATLTAAIQELKATVDAQAARIAALEAKE